MQAFQELLLSVFDNEKEEVFTFVFSDKLPTYDEQDSWAFDGSCNCQGNVGEFTSEILNTLEESRYCYIYDETDNTFYCEGCCEYHSLSGEYVEAENYEKFCSVECAGDCGYLMTENGELVEEDEAFCCEDCCCVYLLEDSYEGAGGCLYCEDCICNHEED